MLTFLDPRSRNQDQDTIIHVGLEQEDLSHTTVFLYSLYRALNFREDGDRKGRMSKLPSPSHGIDDSSAEAAHYMLIPIQNNARLVCTELHKRQ